MSDQTIRAILELVRDNRRFLVASHESPDGDACASTLALTLALRDLGKEVVAYNRDGAVAPFDFLPGAATMLNTLDGESTFDVGFVLDAGELKRIGVDLADRCRKLVNIDHHPHSEDFGDIYFVDKTACATAILIFRLIKQADWPLTRDIAVNLYTAILADTGSFRYSNSNREAFQVASELVDQGLDAWEIASRLYENQPYQRLELLGESLQTLTVSRCGCYATISVSLEMMQRLGAAPEHTDGFVNYPRSIEGVEVAMFFRELAAGRWKVGFRSKGTIDVGALARELGGGGHHNAAGATMEGSLERVRSEVFRRLGIS